MDYFSMAADYAYYRWSRYEKDYASNNIFIN